MDFERAVQSVIDRIAEGFRDSTIADVEALRAAGHLSWEGLIAVLTDRAAGAHRLRAAWLLGRLGEPSALAPLLGALEDPEAALRGGAAYALGSLANPGAIPALARALRHDSDGQVRADAAWALGLMGEDEVIDPLLEALGDAAELPEVRGQAAESLTGPGSARAIPGLLAALTDPSPAIRYWCAFALGELGAREAVPALEHLAATDTAIATGHGSVADEARSALASIRGGDDDADE